MENKVQVSHEHYDIDKYVTFERWQSYFNQVKEVLAFRPKRVLLIGPGDNLVVAMIRNYGIEVLTADIDASLNPDYLCSIEELPDLIKEKFDVVVCCQVLEHLPYEKFNSALQSLKKISSVGAIISLPEKSLRFSFIMKLPVFQPFFLNIVLPFFFMKHKFDGEHYWEIGSIGCGVNKVASDINKVMKIEKFYRLKSNPYHHFFICRY